MILTPTSKSQFFAGAAFWGTIWSIVAELDKIAKPLHLSRWVNRESLLSWIDSNPFLAFICTELINYGRIDASSPAGVTFALGGSVVNLAVIFLVVRYRKAVARIKHQVVSILFFWK